MTLGAVKEYWMASYETENKGLRYTPWVESKLDLVDLVAEKGGTVKSLYRRQGGSMFEETPVGEVPISFG